MYSQSPQDLDLALDLALYCTELYCFVFDLGPVLGSIQIKTPAVFLSKQRVFFALGALLLEALPCVGVISLF